VSGFAARPASSAPARMGRREFVRLATLGAAGAAAVATGGGVLLRFLRPEGAHKPVTLRVDARDVPQRYDEPTQVIVGSYKAWLVWIAANDTLPPQLAAFLGKCPREGCTLPWIPLRNNPASDGLRSNVFRCPCCGSSFTREGRHIFGPAPRDMEHLPLTEYPSGDILIEFERSPLAAS
jgi:cytochrome b6-f complex iron-sulfur subunit